MSPPGASPTSPQDFANQERHHRAAVVIVRAGEERIAALDAMHEAIRHQEIERAIDRDRRRPRTAGGGRIDDFVGAQRLVAAARTSSTLRRIGVSRCARVGAQ